MSSLHARSDFRGPQLLHIAAELALIAAAGFSAFLLRFEFEIPAHYVPHLRVALAVWVLVKLAVFQGYRLGRRSWRFFSVSDVLQLASANAAGALVSLPVILLLAPPGFPRSVPILDFILCSLFIGCRYLIGRLAMEARQARHAGSRDVLIYGAGQAGVMLLNELRSNASHRVNVRGFIDDDPQLADIYVQGTRVLGSGAELSAVALRSGVKEVLIATPSASAEQMIQILQYCQKAQVRYRTVAALGEVVQDKAIASQIREVDVQDLLSRAPVDLDHDLIRDQIEGKVVMVTGAAGSIGSELCRQVARFHPARIVAFEIAETPLFHLEHEMRERFPEVRLMPVIGNVQDRTCVYATIEKESPAVLYHAAAYKHVPIMESSILEAVANNVFGTLNVAAAAARFGVDQFVLISSDKAVRPTSVMGATKRLCELLVREYPSDSTRYVSVRFGNVLGSNGSVIPLFKQQIARGGPVTVTHPEMRRYFMTIPEATQLVLQASAMGEGGEIFVLDMGGQIRIVDVARKLILLSGLVPDVDVRVEFTGIRPGEKLYEELNLDDEVTARTSHPKIKIFSGSDAATGILEQVERLRRLCARRQTGAVVRVIQELVPEYSPSDHALALAAREPEPRPLVTVLHPASRAVS